MKKIVEGNTMTCDKHLRTIFDGDASLYDEIRPGYPEALIRDVIDLTNIPDYGDILEIGCGTGQATMPFAEMGYNIHCLDIGEALASVATKKFQRYPNVKIENVSFEEWWLRKKSYDLVISATAFHWINPKIGYPKTSKALKDSGAIAFFWNFYPYSKSDFFIDLHKLYEKNVPQLDDSYAVGKCYEPIIKLRKQEIIDSGLFRDVIVKRYPWTLNYTADQYLKLLNTYSDHRELGEEQKEKLFNKIHELIEQYGGTINKPYLAVLYCAKKLNRE